jgi:adenosylcobinamide kinase/adenosylcobinamide-phosphate guanylyltransferase
MISLVIGTHNSGKSLLAEELAMKTLDPCKIYLATMKIYDEEGRKRVEKHRKQREGKGFETIERLYDIPKVISEIKNPKATTVLLECVANLVGNEIYENPGRTGKTLLLGESAFNEVKCTEDLEKYADEISFDIRKLSESVHNIVIVTNEYERDVGGYDDATRTYVMLLHMVNERISTFAEQIYDLRVRSNN